MPGGSPWNGLHRDAPPKRCTFFRPEIRERGLFFRLEVWERGPFSGKGKVCERGGIFQNLVCEEEAGLDLGRPIPV